MKSEHYAKLIVHDLPTMTPAEVRRLAQWLRKQADTLSASPKQYDPRYTARLMK